MTTTSSTRHVTKYAPRIAQLNDRLATRVSDAATHLLQRGGYASADTIAVETGLPVARVERLIARSATMATQRQAAVAAAVTPATQPDQAVALADLLSCTPPLLAAVRALNAKAKLGAHNRSGSDWSPVAVRGAMTAGVVSVAASAVVAALYGPWHATATVMVGIAVMLSTAAAMPTIVARDAARAAAAKGVITSADLEAIAKLCDEPADPAARAVLHNTFRSAVALAYHRHAREFTPIAAGMAERLATHSATPMGPAQLLARGLTWLALGMFERDAVDSLDRGFKGIQDPEQRREAARVSLTVLFDGDQVRHHPIATEAYVAQLLLHHRDT